MKCKDYERTTSAHFTSPSCRIKTRQQGVFTMGTMTGYSEQPVSSPPCRSAPQNYPAAPWNPLNMDRHKPKIEIRYLHKEREREREREKRKSLCLWERKERASRGGERDLPNHFPGVRIKAMVRPPLICVRLHQRLHIGHSDEPQPVLLMVKPSSRAAVNNHTKNSNNDQKHHFPHI